MVNKGKKFERQWKYSADSQEICCIRLNDSDLSFNKNRAYRSRFTVQNPCDFILYYNGNMFPLELKSTHYKSFSFQRDIEDKNSFIKLHQINSLVNFSQYDGVIPGFIFNFRDDEVITNEATFFLHIDNFSQFMCDSPKKSINKLDVIQYGGILIPQTLKRTIYVYDVKTLFDTIQSNNY